MGLVLIKAQRGKMVEDSGVETGNVIDVDVEIAIVKSWCFRPEDLERGTLPTTLSAFVCSRLSKKSNSRSERPDSRMPTV